MLLEQPVDHAPAIGAEGPSPLKSQCHPRRHALPLPGSRPISRATAVSGGRSVPDPHGLIRCPVDRSAIPAGSWRLPCNRFAMRKYRLRSNAARPVRGNPETHRPDSVSHPGGRRAVPDRRSRRCGRGRRLGDEVGHRALRRELLAQDGSADLLAGGGAHHLGGGGGERGSSREAGRDPSTEGYRPSPASGPSPIDTRLYFIQSTKPQTKGRTVAAYALRRGD